MKYITRKLSVIVLPEGEPIYSERGTIVEIMDEAAGEFLAVKQCGIDNDRGEIRISPEEWPEIKEAIDLMLYYIADHEPKQTE